MRQMKLLFKGTQSYQLQWTLEPIGIQQASELLIELLTAGQLPVMEFDIARRRLGIATPMIPEDLADTFATLVDQIHDQRYQIKAYVEDVSTFRLVMIDADGNSTRRRGGRRTCGFHLRHSPVGVYDDGVQLKMGRGTIAAAIGRHRDQIPNAQEILQHLSDVIEPIQRQLEGKDEDTEKAV